MGGKWWKEQVKVLQLQIQNRLQLLFRLWIRMLHHRPVLPHVQMQMMQMQQEQQQLAEEAPTLVPSPLESFTNPVSPSTSTSEATPTSTIDIIDHTTTTTAANDDTNDDDNHTPSMQIHLPPASHHPHYHHHQQLIQISPSVLPLPLPRLDSVRVFILRQPEMGAMKMTGRGTPADRRRSAIWDRGGITAAATPGGKCGSGSKRGLDDGREDEQDSEDEGGKRGRPRLRLMLADHDIEHPEPRRGRGRQEEGAKTRLRLSLPDDDTNGYIRMPIVPNGYKCDITESNNDNNDDSDGTTHKPTSSSSSFVATDQTWNAFLASLDDKSQPQQQQQGGEETLESSIIAADSDTTTHGQQQLLLHLDDDHHLSNRHRHRRHVDVGVITPRLGPPSSPTLEGSSGGMFMFDQGGVGDSSNTWFGDGLSEGSGVGVGSVRSGVVDIGAGSSGTCPSDALALEGLNFPVGPDGSSTLSYTLSTLTPSPIFHRRSSQWINCISSAGL
ncbi:hypothetical protein BYT27DRAFT_6870046 [Phlegmacium glaucopus]|nr:hypothetical protein BYT27DRAFT_6870046 [Phlegmacium glaucopus]